MSEPVDEVEALEGYLLRIVPGLAGAWRGCSDEQIGRIEAIVGDPLPRFYRWFLRTMGASMGPAGYALVDFTADRVLECHARGLARVPGRCLLIGHDRDRVLPLHFFYDLERGARDDARIVRMGLHGESRTDTFETFREMLAWNNTGQFRVDTRAYSCEGFLEHSDGDVFGRLGPVLARLGLTAPIATGPACGVYDSDGASMLCTVSPDTVPSTFQTFRLGADDEGTLRTILGRIADESALDVEVETWSPDR